MEEFLDGHPLTWGARGNWTRLRHTISHQSSLAPITVGDTPYLQVHTGRTPVALIGEESLHVFWADPVGRNAAFRQQVTKRIFADHGLPYRVQLRDGHSTAWLIDTRTGLDAMDEHVSALNTDGRLAPEPLVQPLHSSVFRPRGGHWRLTMYNRMAIERN